MTAEELISKLADMAAEETRKSVTKRLQSELGNLPSWIFEQDNALQIRHTLHVFLDKTVLTGPNGDLRLKESDRDDPRG